MEIDSIVSFLKAIGSQENTVIFRGQACSSWTLLPSIARLDYKQSPMRHQDGWKGIEEHLLGEFKRYASMHLKQEPKNKLEWMIQAQHHGLPTRLLDWSTNPLKALYFAVENAKHHDVDGEVFVYKPRMWSASHHEIGNIERTNCIDVFYPVVINKRVLAQEGCFILFPQKLDYSDYEPSVLDERQILPIVIDKEHKQAILTELQILGINDMTMFPDLDGIAKNITRMFGAL